ncbi:MAG TPA: YheC/YheD family protein [Clostridia bacterium]|nr:YheC/YheD family protein [Clostridia bacterium]
MWAKIKIIHSEKDAVYLPEPFMTPGRPFAEVRFGGIQNMAEVIFTHARSPEGKTFSDPAVIGLSEPLAKTLMIPLCCVYRVVLRPQSIAFGPVIGLLLGIHTNRYTPDHMEKYSDRFGIYPEIGGLICAFSPKSVDWHTHSACGLIFNPEENRWEYGCFPLPDVIYRRDFHMGSLFIKQLSEFTNGRLFNSYRFTKFELYDYIRNNRSLRQYIPPTELCIDFRQAFEFIRRHPTVILKPVDLSRGRGICVIEQDGEGYRVSDYRERDPHTILIADKNELEQFFRKNPGFFDQYLIQQYLRLAHIGDSLFDIRVVMQKRQDRSWGCTGIECRVSGPGYLLTNISRGGSALTLSEALRRAFGAEDEACKTLPPKIDALCREFCLYMDTTGEHFAEFGMDIAVDTDKNIWLIEANVFPSFKGFKRTDKATYLAIRHQPLRYALSLTEFNEKA